MKRTGTAVWNGSGKDGSGHLTTQSTTLNNVQYSYKSRFEQGVGTNPEELIAAAHSGCFAMALSFVLQEAGLTADSLDVTCTITLEPGVGITHSDLVLKAKIPGVTPEKFQEYAAAAKANCPVSKLMKAEISLNASLV
ncbi:MAG TPA: OsmC family protein [Puia sp.]|jgi:osmotically inducible protein OsmC|nr:OsmC family protein [Puia sp.]